MPRQRKPRRTRRTRKTQMNLSDLIDRARMHPLTRQRKLAQRGRQSQMRRGSNIVAEARAIRQQQMLQLMQTSSVITTENGEHQHVSEDEIPEQQRSSRKRRTVTIDTPQNNSTIVLHHNPHFNTLGRTCSGQLRRNADNNEGTGDSQSNKSGGIDDDDVEFIPNKRVSVMGSEVEAKGLAMDAAARRRTIGKSKNLGRASNMSVNSGDEGSDQSKSTSEETNSYDGDGDDASKQRPAFGAESLQPFHPPTTAPNGMGGNLSTARTMGTGSAGPHMAALGCPTLSDILLSVDNFLKKRCEFLNQR